MSNNVDLKKGLNLPIKGEAAQKIRKGITPSIVAVKPTDFKGLTPRLLVKEGDEVLAGTPILADKVNPSILFTSPVSGVVQSVVRGEKRKLLEVLIKANENQEYIDFGSKEVKSLSLEEVKGTLLKSGLWASFIQRPYGIIANPELKPKAIFISGFSTAPLAADMTFMLKEEVKNIQTAINNISKLTDGGVHLSLNSDNYASSPFNKLENVILHTISGKHPAGNVGIQIHHISPIQKGETVWTISLESLAAIGRLFNTGKLDLRKKVAITGPRAIEPAYVTAVSGMSMHDIAEFYDNSNDDIRFISGDVLSGTNVGKDGYLGFFDNQVSLIKEGKEFELFGWAKPFRFNKFSTTRSYFSWLCPKKKYDMDTNINGGPRAFIMSDVYGKVLPMDIFPVYLVKACIARNIDDMEKFGIYEVLPEDLALCEYVCPSKIDIQAIVDEAISLMIKEMA